MNPDFLSEIPIKTYTRYSEIGKSYLAKSAVISIANHQKEIFSGFCYCDNKEKAEFISKMEVLERLFSSGSFLKELGEYKDYYSAESWPSSISNAAVIFPCNQILLDEPSDKLTDASGLSAHTDLSSAMSHAVYEIIERHFLTEIWYGNQLLSEVTDHSTINLAVNYHIRYFTANLPSYLPFIICTIEDDAGNLFALGSKLSTNFENSIQKAQEEALMMVDSLINHDDGYCYSEETKERVLSLFNINISTSRKEFFYKKIVETLSIPEPQLKEDLSKTIINYLDSHDIDIYVANIYNSEELHIVRALSKQLKRIRVARSKADPAIPSDPFC